MAKLSEEFASDSSSIEDGKWFTLRPASKDSPAMRMRIRASSSKTFRKTETKLQKKYRGAIVAGGGYLDPDSQDEFDVELLVGGTVVDWEGVEGDNGLIPYSRANASKVFAEFPQLRREVFAWARSEENFKPAEQLRAEQDAIVKN